MTDSNQRPEEQFMPHAQRLEYMLADIKKERPLIYLACAYASQTEAKKERRFQIVSEVAGKLIKAGNLIYSPITHSHPLEQYGNVNGGTDFWIEYDEFYLERCDILMVLQVTEAWRRSAGILRELDYCHDRGKAIIFLPYEGDDTPLDKEAPLELRGHF